MTTIAVVPVKHLSDAKTRLAGRLTPAERRTLVLELLDHLLGVLIHSELIEDIIVVSPDPEIGRKAEATGATALLQSGAGLNEAILLGRDEALRRGADGMLVLLADLPLLTSADVDAIVRSIGDSAVVLAPDRHERGTNALAMRPPEAIEPAFGIDSLHRHRLAACEHGLTTREYRAQGTGFDIDTPADLEEFRRVMAQMGRDAT